MSKQIEEEAGSPPAAETAPPERATISRRAAERLRAGHVWVYASDIVEVTPRGAAAGLVPVYDQPGRLLGTALYSPASQIALRMVAVDAPGQQEFLARLRRRLGASIAERAATFEAGTDACRLAFAEADELPGIVLDKYGDLVVLQLLVRALDTDEGARRGGRGRPRRARPRAPSWSARTRVSANSSR